MKKFKFTLGLLVIIFVALVIYQNRAYFFAKQALSLVIVPEKFQWTAPAIENVAYFGGCIIIGILIAGYIGLVSKFRSMKNIKQLNKTILSQTETIESLKSELETFKQNNYLEDSSINNENLLPDNEPILVENQDTNYKQEEFQQSVNLNKA
ncbi:hypothetical protein MCHI_000033 [Candidatus Magnetoovum chiemensis]|nr:hypothetical protein MCHI_000033 [Candidatus Magnetoovum chiemensis]